jgi:arylsulfatase A-like enzyme
MPEYWHMYSKDPDYLGTLTQLDVQFGRIIDLLKSTNVYDNTVRIFQFFLNCA